MPTPLVAIGAQHAACHTDPARNWALNLKLNPAGATRIEGASGTGKSVLISLVTWALLGTLSTGAPWSDALTPEGGATKVRLRLADGRAIDASRKHGGDLVREVIDSANKPLAKFKTAAEWKAWLAEEMPALARHPELARLIIVPGSEPGRGWQGLLERNMGRDLRDLLMRLLPARDERVVIAGLMKERGLELKASDLLPNVEDKAKERAGKEPRSLAKRAADQQTEANASLKAAEALLNDARARLGALGPTPEPISDEDLAPVVLVLAAAKAWADYEGANSGLADLRARRDQLQRRVEAEAPEGVDSGYVAKADAALAAEKAWAAHDRAVESWSTAIANIERIEAANAERAAKRTALGARPQGPLPAQITSAENAVARGEDTLQKLAVKPAETARASHAAAVDALAKFDDAGGKCPTCKQKMPDQADAREAARAKVEATQKALEEAEARVASSTATLDGLRAALKELTDRRDATARWDQASLLIGKDEDVPERDPEPKAPTAKRPDARMLTWAAETKQEQARAEGAIEAHRLDVAAAQRELGTVTAQLAEAGDTKPPDVERPAADIVESARRLQTAAAVRATQIATAKADRAREEKAVATAEQKATEATAEAERCKGLAESARKAPSVIVREQVEAFGDMGDLTIDIPEEGNRNTAAMRILVKGEDILANPHACSTGELVLACLNFRLRLRELADLPWLPVFVDRAEAWNGGEGPWPEAAGVVYLHNVAGAELKATAGVAMREAS